ncbi:hypothetical protein EJB05_08042, partial [Eragrostis curvula]
MERTGKRWLPRLLFIVALSATPWLLVVYTHLLVFHGAPTSAPHASLVAVASSDGEQQDAQRFLLQQEQQLNELKSSASAAGSLPAAREEEERRRTHGDDAAAVVDPCHGRYVYIHDLPPRFNADILAQCHVWYPWHNMCSYLTNAGLGLPVNNSDGVFADQGWYATDHFGLDVIFHRRVQQYGCLTNDSSRAAAFFVPFYAGFDVVQHLWGHNASTKDALSLDLARWLTRRPEWRGMGGRDHFVISGRTAYDHQRDSDSDSEWGNKFLRVPAVQNMTVLVVEKTPWLDFPSPIPYPTYFHPAKDAEIFDWQRRMRAMKRDWLFTFAGGERPDDPTSIRNHLVRQCNATSSCKLIRCRKSSRQCLNPSTFMGVFQKTRFCLQPAGDTYTRRSAFDAIMAGCVPVFFHPLSAHAQYKWHLPEAHDTYSVLIPEDDVRAGNVRIEEALRRIPTDVAERMTQTVIDLIPRLVYADPRSKLETVKDAVDVTMEAIIAKVNKLRKEMRGGQGHLQTGNGRVQQS